MDAATPKTGWFIRKIKVNGKAAPVGPRSHYPVFIFPDGQEKTYSIWFGTVEECRRTISLFFDQGAKIPSRPNQPWTMEETEATLHQARIRMHTPNP